MVQTSINHAGPITANTPLPTVIHHAKHHLAALVIWRAEIYGADEHLTPLTTEAAHLTTLLDLILSLPILQTPDIATQTRRLTKFAAGLGSSMMLMVEVTRKSRRLGGVEGTKVLRPGDGEYRHLGVMVGEVRGWKRKLEGGVRGVVVGLRGDVRVGFKVSRKELVDVNERVKEVLGAELMVAERLAARLAEGTGDYIRLDDGDAACLGLPQTTSTRVEQWRAQVSD